MNLILKKLFFKNQEPVLILGLPPEFQKLSKEFGTKTHTIPTGKYGFILAFVKSLADGEKLAKRLILLHIRLIRKYPHHGHRQGIPAVEGVRPIKLKTFGVFYSEVISFFFFSL